MAVSNYPLARREALLDIEDRVTNTNIDSNGITIYQCL